jgi:serine/threonine protein kinase
MITQLNNEIKISRQLDHPNIIKLYDTFDDGENIYLVLELAQNGQLFSKVVREGKLDEKTVKQMILEVLEAVEYLHSRDPPIIHRDIKPENILLDKKNHVKLAGTPALSRLRLVQLPQQAPQDLLRHLRLPRPRNDRQVRAR